MKKTKAAPVSTAFAETHAGIRKILVPCTIDGSCQDA
jgi:hypothetical protein